MTVAPAAIHDWGRAGQIAVAGRTAYTGSDTIPLAMDNDPVIFRALADAVLVLHVGIVAFIVGGLALVLAGGYLRWAWVRNLHFRVLHLAAIGYVVVTTWFGIDCALTTLEQGLRIKAGQPVTGEDFIAHWLGQILFYHAPPWVFVSAYSAFGLLVLWSWFAVRPRP